MEVILLEKVEHLGGIGDRVAVKPGFARNYLIPQGKATEATPANVARFEARRAELEARAAAALADAEARREQLADLVVTLSARAGGEGRLYGSVTPADIAGAVTTAGIELKKHEVRLPEGSIRHTGEYDVEIRLHSDVRTHIRINVVAD